MENSPTNHVAGIFLPLQQVIPGPLNNYGNRKTTPTFPKQVSDKFLEQNSKEVKSPQVQITKKNVNAENRFSRRMEENTDFRVKMERESFKNDLLTPTELSPQKVVVIIESDSEEEGESNIHEAQPNLSEPMEFEENEMG